MNKQNKVNRFCEGKIPTCACCKIWTLIMINESWFHWKDILTPHIFLVYQFIFRSIVKHVSKQKKFFVLLLTMFSFVNNSGRHGSDQKFYFEAVTNKWSTFQKRLNQCQKGQRHLVPTVKYFFMSNNFYYVDCNPIWLKWLEK